MDIDTSNLERLGRSKTSEIFLFEPNVMLCVPFKGLRDDEDGARSTVEFYHRYLARVGRRGGAIVLMERLIEQDPKARSVYSTMPDPHILTGFALLGGTMLARAISSVFMGLVQLSVPTKLFGKFDDGLAFVRKMNAERGGPTAKDNR